MKLLLDESIPRQLADLFPENLEIHTAPQMDWAGKTNGELLLLAAQASFSALVTADRNIEYQQNIKTLPIAVIVLTFMNNLWDSNEILVKLGGTNYGVYT